MSERPLSLALAAALMSLPLPLSAEELGSITGFLDGKDRLWHTITLDQGGKRVATATLLQQGHFAELRIQGHPVPAFTSKEVISIDARFPVHYKAGDQPTSVEILYTPNGLSGPLWTSRDAPVPPRLEILELDAWGGVGSVLAVITGQVCKRPSLFSRTDTSDCKNLNGKIETRIEVSATR